MFLTGLTAGPDEFSSFRGTSLLKRGLKKTVLKYAERLSRSNRPHAEHLAGHSSVVQALGSCCCQSELRMHVCVSFPKEA